MEILEGMINENVIVGLIVGGAIIALLLREWNK